MSAGPSLLDLLRRMFLQFLLPILAAGPVMFGGEKLLQLLGVPITDTQFVRLLLLGVYGLVAVAVIKRRKPAEPAPAELGERQEKA